MSKINVAVLMGGKSAEREISLSTGQMILGALNPEKYNAFPVDSACFGIRSHAKKLSVSGRLADCMPVSKDMLPLDYLVHPNGSHPKPDVVFIALHGRFGEDGTVQGMLELLGITYVGSGVLASALAMDKIMTRKMLLYEGITVPAGVSVRQTADAKSLSQVIESQLGYPVVVKPNREGSTIGLSIARTVSEFPTALELALKYDEDVLVEEHIAGTEISVGVLGNDDLEALPIVEIVPESGFYDYYSKYTPGATEEIVPARIPQRLYRKAEEYAIACHRALGCRGISRTDMIVRGEKVYVLEVNTIPGMTPTSLVPRAAQAAGIEFPDLLDRLISYALEGK